MPSKALTFIIAVILIIQLFVSFYYSSEILGQNTLYEHNKQKLNELQDVHQYLQNQFTFLTSLQNFSRQIDPSLYQPIKETIDLNRLHQL